MFGRNGISPLETPHSAIAKSVQRLNVKVTSSQGEIAMPMISADTYRLSIQVPASWLIPSAPRTSFSATDVTWSLNSDVIAAMRTPQRPKNGLISMGYDNSFSINNSFSISRDPSWPVRRHVRSQSCGINNSDDEYARILNPFLIDPSAAAYHALREHGHRE